MKNEMPSSKNFGFFLVFCLMLLSIYEWYMSNYVLSKLLIVSELIIFTLAIYRPHYLSFINKVWFNFGQVLGKLSSPLILGFIFFLILSPIAIVTRFFGRDLLLLRKRYIKTYWINRINNVTNYESFKNQF